MIHINSISYTDYTDNKYHINKIKKIQPISEININCNKNNTKDNTSSNSPDFREILEEELKKAKKTK